MGSIRKYSNTNQTKPCHHSPYPNNIFLWNIPYPALTLWLRNTQFYTVHFIKHFKISTPPYKTRHSTMCRLCSCHNCSMRHAPFASHIKTINFYVHVHTYTYTLHMSTYIYEHTHNNFPKKWLCQTASFPVDHANSRLPIYVKHIRLLLRAAATEFAYSH